MNVLPAIYDALSARELASITILGLFIVLSLLSENVRKRIISIITTLFKPKVFMPILLLYGCIVATCYALYYKGLWSNEYTKDVVFYALTAVPVIIDVIGYESQEEFGRLIIKQVHYTAFIALYLNIYTFSYWVELVLQLVLCILAMLITTLERQNKQDKSSKLAYGCLNKCSALIGWTIFVFVLYQVFTHSILQTSQILIQGIATPLVLTIAICPYLYLLTVYSVYEAWFLRLKWSVNQNKVDYRKRRHLLLRTCLINLKKIKYFEQRIKLYMINDNSEFIDIVHRCNIEYKTSK